MDEIAMLVIPLTILGGPMIVFIVHILAKSMVQMVCHWKDVDLKIRLVERGMTPAEIERVLDAGRYEKAHGKKPPVDPKAKLAY
jgi:hypothetical protein